jgi:DNA-binding transcriptional LysR family regulator
MEFPADNERLTRELDWNLLRTFMIVVQEGGVSKGANRLRLRQPSVSQALKRLEDRLQTQLIERSPSTFRITPAGRHLYRECIEVYGTISRAISIGQGIEDELTGKVTIAAFSRIESDLVDKAQSQFHRLHTKVAFEINVMPSKEVQQTVLEKAAGLGICLVYDKHPKLVYEQLYRNYFGFFCGPSHPLFGKENLKIQDLRGHSSVSFKTDQLWDALRPVALMRAHHKLDDQVIGYTSHLGEAIRMIAAGLGFGPLPVHVAETLVQSGKLWRLPPYEDTLEIDVFLLTNANSRLNRAEAAFLEFLRKEVSAIPLDARTYHSRTSR